MREIAAALWLGALWYVAPLLDASAREAPARHLRDAIVLGVAIPLVLGTAGALAPVPCAAAILLLAIVRTVVRPPAVRPVAASPWHALPAVAVVAVSWPALVRPLLQGDSLGYHLPNAASWSTTHAIWTTVTWYWFYPGGSELFAAGLDTIAGPLAVGFAGFAALLLLAYRIAAFAERAGCSAFQSGALAAAFVTVPAVALQGGSLENDVWLAAWLLETAWALLEERPVTRRALTVAALVKPYGFIFAALAAWFGRARRLDVVLGFAPLALWFVRDAVLWRGAIIDPAALSDPHVAATTILAQGAAGVTTLASALWNAGPGMLVACLAFVATVATSREPVLRWSALGAFAFFLIEPFGFRNDGPQLATGASLRYAFPALALGFTGALPLVRRVPWPNAVACAALALAALQIRGVAAIFENDATTHRWYLAAIVVAAAIVADAWRARGFATPLVSLALVAYAVRFAGSHPADYYDDLISSGNGKSHLFEWLAAERPPRVVGDTIRLGSIVVVSPGTLAQNTVRVDPCGEARRAHALLVVADDPPTNAAAFAARRAAGRACGRVLYEDERALAVAP
jgi:hypothetical protein